MQAGLLRQKVRLQRRSDSIDEVGGQSSAWVDVAEMFVRIEPTDGKEYLVGGAIRDVGTHTIYAWFSPDVKAEMRFLYGDRVFNLIQVSNVDERDRELLISANEGLNQG